MNSEQKEYEKVLLRHCRMEGYRDACHGEDYRDKYWNDFPDRHNAYIQGVEDYSGELKWLDE